MKAFKVLELNQISIKPKTTSLNFYFEIHESVNFSPRTDNNLFRSINISIEIIFSSRS